MPGRASDADRERFVELLQARSVEGRLSTDTFARRLEGVLARAQHGRARRDSSRTSASPAAPGARSLRAVLVDCRRWSRTSRQHGADPRLPVLALPDESMSIGRAPDCDCLLTEPSVSRRHAQLRRDGERWLLRDLGSRNGTRLNGARVTEEIEVRPGDHAGGLAAECATGWAAARAALPARSTGERSSEPTVRTASSTPGMNDSRSIESWRIVSVWPGAAEEHLLVGHQAGQAHRVDRLVHVPAGRRDQLGGALGRARRGVELAVVVQLDDLALGHVRAPPARRTASSAPRRSRSSGATNRLRLPHALELGEVGAGGAHHAVHAASRQARALASAVSGVEKSTTTSASPSTSASAVSSSGSARPDQRHVLGALHRAADRLAHAPGGAGDGDVDHAAAASAGLTASSAERKVVLVRRPRRPPTGAPGSHSSRASAVTSSSVTASNARQHLVDGQQRHAHQHRAAQPVHARRASTPSTARCGPSRSRGRARAPSAVTPSVAAGGAARCRSRPSPRATLSGRVPT